MEHIFLIWENPGVRQPNDQRAGLRPFKVVFLALLAVRGLQHGSSKSLVE